MALRKITDAAAEPVTLAEAKANCRVTDSASDALLTALITAARTQCEHLLERTLIQTVWRLTLDEFPDAFRLPMPPAMSIVHVKYIDVNGVQQTLGGAGYFLDNESTPAWLVPAFDASWPATRDQVNAVEVQWLAGYGATASDVPRPIKEWILRAVGDLYANRERSAEKPVVPQGFLDGLLDPYRVLEV